ncbi:BCL2/adenovirus E1B 19 kDa protein-interacting protein 3-like isoform X2 [Salvelinus namaycush]|uniref:BCL2/adenovirus E1B 19 kDa protein-interacting protein 3-like isoform X2 n=1 Tax=Salvelinus namaycush TaxID=8040 RepID=A0A8U0P0R6_SALNM|nr:BCL2/adenovirus E1B 19 kDa protein-interacting protein 3-like isoform X2 [Salvelinus namaycush]
MTEDKQSVIEENLQGSWVELHFNNGNSGGSPAHGAAGVEEEQVSGSATELPGSVTELPGSATELPGSVTELPGSATELPGSATELPGSATELPGSGSGASASVHGGDLMAGSTSASVLPGSLSASTQGGDLIPGSGSASGSVQGGVDLERMLLDAQHESGRSSSRGSVPCDSPPRPQTPLLRRDSEVHSSGEKNSSQSEEDYLERRREVENLMKKNADWIWDWSSRPENIQRKEFVLKHPKRTNPLSIRNTSVMKNGGIFSAEFLKLFLPSLLISHVLAIGLGVYIGRRLTTSVTSTF